jgi:hypothetical protein
LLILGQSATLIPRVSRYAIGSTDIDKHNPQVDTAIRKY